MGCPLGRGTNSPEQLMYKLEAYFRTEGSSPGVPNRAGELLTGSPTDCLFISCEQSGAMASEAGEQYTAQLGFRAGIHPEYKLEARS